MISIFSIKHWNKEIKVKKLILVINIEHKPWTLNTKFHSEIKHSSTDYCKESFIHIREKMLSKTYFLDYRKMPVDIEDFGVTVVIFSN